MNRPFDPESLGCATIWTKLQSLLRLQSPNMSAAPSHSTPPPLRAQIEPALKTKLLSFATFSDGPHEEIEVLAPWTGEVMARIPGARKADVDLAIQRARAAQQAWAARPIRERTRVLLRFHDLLFKRKDEVLDLIQIENGKARRHAFEEVLDTAVVARYYARRAARLLRTRRRKGALPVLTRTLEVRSPVGVAGFISAWNFPLILAITDLLPALAAGNAAVLKPDIQTCFTALWAAGLLREAGLPEGVLQVLVGDGGLIGPLLNEQVDYLMFTGSTRTGKLVARQAAERLIGCSLELGGKNPMLVLRDADLDRAARGAVIGCFTGAGQVCVSIERLYVHESIFDEFVRRFVERTRAMRIGPGFDLDIEIGSMTTAAQVTRVEEHVQDAVAKGASVAAGGHRRPDLGPLFFEPTILLNVREGMRIFEEETFGPVVSIYPFTTEQEAIDRANASRFGLSASIWTRDTARGVRIGRQLHTGNVNVNEAYAATWASIDSPMGGRKESGLQARHAAIGLLKYTHSQTLAVQRLLPIGPPRWIEPGLHARIMVQLLKLMRWTRILG